MQLHSIPIGRKSLNSKLISHGNRSRSQMTLGTLNPATHYKNISLYSIARLCIFLLMVLLPSIAGATHVNLAWDPVSPAPSGYRIYMRTASGGYNFSSPAWQGTTAATRIDQLQPGQTYSFVARAFSASRESGNSNEVTYTVPNLAPLAHAGPDLAVNGGASVTLDGSASRDPDGTIAAYRWTQILGPAVSLVNSTSARAAFQAPRLTSVATLKFQLTVTDNLGLASSHTCTVTVAATATSGGGGTAPGQPDAGNSGAAKIWIEAEDGDIFAPMQITAHTSASNGDCVVSPGGSGANGYAAYRFDIQNAGNYWLWGRVLAPNEASNSFFVSVNGAANVNWHLPANPQWQWVRYGAVMAFQQGRQSILVRHREFNTHLDRLLITNDGAYVPRGEGESSGYGPGSHVVIEAESGVLSRPMQVRHEPGASGNGFVWVPDGKGSITSPSENAGRVVYDFHVPQDGDYRIWGRVRAPSSMNDSFFVAVNGGNFERWNTPQGTTWTWGLVNSHGVADPRTYRLKAGRHTLTLMQREEGTQLDKMIVTNNPDYVPTGEGEAATPSAEPVTHVDMEAEDALIISKFRIQNDSAASSGAFLWVPNGGGNYGSPSPASGQARFDFYVSERGDYRIWARVLAPSAAEDSFFLAMNDGPIGLWSPRIDSRWNWQAVSVDAGATTHYRLDPGMHQLHLMHREDGTRIDRLIITKNPAFTPN
jgi:hypothetical protein